jgi:hypothetical protein
MFTINKNGKEVFNSEVTSRKIALATQDARETGAKALKTAKTGVAWGLASLASGIATLALKLSEGPSVK